MPRRCASLRGTRPNRLAPQRREVANGFNEGSSRSVLKSCSGRRGPSRRASRRDAAPIETPVFMPVGTAGTVKGTRFEVLESPELDARIILGNTYHLWLRPGIETIRACGGLHRFIGWDRAHPDGFGRLPGLESGRVAEDHAKPELSFVRMSMAVCDFCRRKCRWKCRRRLVRTLSMAFDECAPGEATHDETRRSMELTTRWAKRSRGRLMSCGTVPGSWRAGGTPAVPGESLSGAQALFGIVQGATHLISDARVWSAPLRSALMGMHLGD